MKKIYIQCGEEGNCKERDCLKCKIKNKYYLTLTHAEISVIEDLAIGDLEVLRKEKPKQLDLMQKIMTNIMKKVFKKSDNLGNKTLRRTTENEKIKITEIEI